MNNNELFPQHENIYRNTSKLHITTETELSFSTEFRNSALRHKDVSKICLYYVQIFLLIYDLLVFFTVRFQDHLFVYLFFVLVSCEFGHVYSRNS